MGDGGDREDQPTGDDSAGSGAADSDAPVETGGSPPAPEASAASVPGWKAAISNPAYRFVFFFLLYLGIIAVGYPVARERFIHLVDALATGTAWLEYHFFALFTRSVHLADKVVIFQGFAVKIIEECTGVYEVLIFSAAVLAFPTSIKKKAIGLAMGVPLLYFFNVARIALLIMVGRYFPKQFDFVHLYFMQATLILMITSVWLLWIIKVVRDEPPRPVIPS